MLRNLKASEDEKNVLNGRCQNWRSSLLDIMKYPFAIVLFNISVFMFLKMKMIDGNLELVLKEATPTFY